MAISPRGLQWRHVRYAPRHVMPLKVSGSDRKMLRRLEPGVPPVFVRQSVCSCGMALEAGK
jgi:hypothetical protein